MIRILSCTALAFALILPAAAPAQAGPPAAHVPPALAAPEGVLAAARGWLLARFQPAAPPPAKRPTPPGKSMCGMDPDGHQVPCR